MADPVANVLLRHTDALRELARALVGSDHADDVAQSAAAAALAHRGAVHEPLAFVRHLLRVHAARHHRAQARRRSRELVAAQRAEVAAPAAEHALEHRETVAALHAALMAVPQPHLGALLLRYFEGLSPTTIADRLALPLPTVKSRLQRGVTLLRERLAAGPDGGAWRERLCRAFGLSLPVPTLAATPALASPLLLVLMMKIAASLFVLAAVAVVAWWSWPPSPSTPRAAVAEAAGSLAVDAHTAGEDAPPPSREPAAAIAPPPHDRRARVIGRVTDGERPLRDVLVEVLPEIANATPVAVATTGDDGTFVCDVDAPGEHHVRLVAAGFVGMRSTARTLAPGGVLDLGTVAMQPGVALRGRVVDRDDHPVAGTTIALNANDQPLAAGFWWSKNLPTTDADGRFELAPVLPIEHRLFLAKEELLDPKTIDLTGRRGDTDLLVRVESATRHPRVRGSVVDERGMPVAAARVTVADRADGGQVLFDALSAPDGTFELRRLRTTPAKTAALTATAAGFDETSIGEVAWDARGVVVVLRPLVGLTVRVVDAAGAAVPDYTLHVAGIGAGGSTSWHTGAFDVHEVRGAADGSFAVTGLRRAPHDVHVVPVGSVLAASGVQRVVVGGGGQHHEVVLQSSTERVLELRFADDTPVAGARLELCRPCLGDVDLNSYVVGLERWTLTHVPGKALLLQAAVSDATGRALLRGPAASRLVLRVLGPGCLPFVAAIDRLDGEGPLVVRARRGGTVRVAASPAAVLAELESLRVAGLDQPMPCLWLERPLARGRERVPPRRVAGEPFDHDGVATLRGVPDGTWTPWVELAAECFRLPDVTVHEGDVAPLAWDLASLRPVTVRGAVVCNGTPAGPRQVDVERLRRADERHAGRWVPVGSSRVALDAQGRFVLRSVPGTFRVLLPQQRSDDHRNAVLTTPGTLDVAPGTSVEQAFAATLGNVAVRFVDATQRPVAGVSAWLQRGDGYFVAHLPLSDADGRARGVDFETSGLSLAALPRRFGDARTGLGKLYTDHPDDPGIVERTRLELGRVVVRSGEPIEHTIVLPDAWFR